MEEKKTESVKGERENEWRGGKKYMGESEWGIDMRQREGMRRGRVQQRLIDTQE